jgi:hypothetical protein
MLQKCTALQKIARCIKGEWQLNFALWQNQNLTFCKNICTSTKIEQQQQQQERQHILDLFFIQDPETYFFDHHLRIHYP